MGENIHEIGDSVGIPIRDRSLFALFNLRPETTIFGGGFFSKNSAIARLCDEVGGPLC
jgi:hypothetical protein